MNRVQISNRINRYTGGDELLFCTRVYVNSKVWGGSWIALRITIDYSFYRLTGYRQHCRASYLWERRNNETQKQAHQIGGKTP
jgi:hypothetical protein